MQEFVNEASTEVIDGKVVMPKRAALRRRSWVGVKKSTLGGVTEFGKNWSTFGQNKSNRIAIINEKGSCRSPKLTRTRRETTKVNYRN